MHQRKRSGKAGPEAGSRSAKGKKPYHRPVLINYGTFEQITKAKTFDGCGDCRSDPGSQSFK